jgi:hypothetical protein
MNADSNGFHLELKEKERDPARSATSPRVAIQIWYPNTVPEQISTALEFYRI